MTASRRKLPLAPGAKADPASREGVAAGVDRRGDSGVDRGGRRDVVWLGEAPPPALAAALSARGVVLHAASEALTARAETNGPADVDAPWPVIVCTTHATRVPDVDARLHPWIWLTREWPGDACYRDAVLAGAYDVIAWDRNVADAADAARAASDVSGEASADAAIPDVIAQLLARIDELRTVDPPPPDADGLVTASEASRRVLAQVARVAPTAMPVLLTGETGTGKEVLARLIHAWSPRRAQRFVPINCAAIPNELMEAELFGYARGAFSGAVQTYDGQLMAASGGTAFMDEIDDTPLATQVKLLRVLEDRIVSRLGENDWHQVDFRIIAATNRDLRPLIAQNCFGADLYERLAIVTIHLRPLRERSEDLPALARHFLARFAHEHPQTGAARVKDIRADALRALQAYAWPGNIRELRNVIYETLVYKRAGDEILPADLPRRILARDTASSASFASIRSGAADSEAADSGLDGRAGASAGASMTAGSPGGIGTRATAGTIGTIGASTPPATLSTLINPERVATLVAQGRFNLRDEVATLQRAALEEALRRSGGNATRAARLLGSVGRGRASDPGGTVRAMMRRLGLGAEPEFAPESVHERESDRDVPQRQTADRPKPSTKAKRAPKAATKRARRRGSTR